MAEQAKAHGITQDEAEEGFLNSDRPTTLINRSATTDEVANMIVYTCSTQALAPSGAALRVDGGIIRFVARDIAGGRCERHRALPRLRRHG